MEIRILYTKNLPVSLYLAVKVLSGHQDNKGERVSQS